MNELHRQIRDGLFSFGWYSIGKVQGLLVRDDQVIDVPRVNRMGVSAFDETIMHPKSTWEMRTAFHDKNSIWIVDDAIDLRGKGSRMKRQ
jgi:hypothetical protein